MPVLIESLDPAVARLNRKLTAITLGLKHHRPVYNTPASNTLTVQSRSAETRFAETRFAETLTLTLTLNPNFGKSGFGESGKHQPLTLISANLVSANRADTHTDMTFAFQINKPDL